MEITRAGTRTRVIGFTKWCPFDTKPMKTAHFPVSRVPAGFTPPGTRFQFLLSRVRTPGGSVFAVKNLDLASLQS